MSWNFAKRDDPWRELDKMAQRGEADVALLQEAGCPPNDLIHLAPHDDDIHWARQLYNDRWPLVVQLSDRVKVERFRQVPPISKLGEANIGASGIGTMAVARVTPSERPEKAFLTVSMYARWMRSHPSTSPRPRIHCDMSAHRLVANVVTKRLTHYLYGRRRWRSFLESSGSEVFVAGRQTWLCYCLDRERHFGNGSYHAGQGSVWRDGGW